MTINKARSQGPQNGSCLLVRAGHHQIIRPGRRQGPEIDDNSRPGPKNEADARACTPQMEETRDRSNQTERHGERAINSRAPESWRVDAYANAMVGGVSVCVWRGRWEGRERNDDVFIAATRGGREARPYGGRSGVRLAGVVAETAFWPRPASLSGRRCGRGRFDRDAAFRRQGPWPKMPRQPPPLLLILVLLLPVPDWSTWLEAGAFSFCPV